MSKSSINTAPRPQARPAIGNDKTSETLEGLRGKLLIAAHYQGCSQRRERLIYRPYRSSRQCLCAESGERFVRTESRGPAADQNKSLGFWQRSIHVDACPSSTEGLIVTIRDFEVG